MILRSSVDEEGGWSGLAPFTHMQLDTAADHGMNLHVDPPLTDPGFDYCRLVLEEVLALALKKGR
jgi:hypothetical protein